jgi:hypothetical protein
VVNNNKSQKILFKKTLKLHSIVQGFPVLRGDKFVINKAVPFEPYNSKLTLFYDDILLLKIYLFSANILIITQNLAE